MAAKIASDAPVAVGSNCSRARNRRQDSDTPPASAVVAQRRAELTDVISQVEEEVRAAYLDLEAALSLVDVSQRSVGVAREVLDLTRQRYDAGVTSNIEVVQAQESVATAELDYINSVFAHSVGKLNLARAIGQAVDRWPELFALP